MSADRNRAELIDEREAAALLGISPVTLRTWRFENRAPPRYVFGRTIRYARSDVDRFKDSHRVS